MKKIFVWLLVFFSSVALAVVPPMPEEQVLQISQVVVKGFVHRIELENVNTQKGSETRTYKALVYVYNLQKGNLELGKSIVVRFALTRVAPSAAGPAVSCGSTIQAVLRLGEQNKLFLNKNKDAFEFSHNSGVRLEKAAAKNTDLPDEASPVQEMAIPSGLK